MQIYTARLSIRIKALASLTANLSTLQVPIVMIEHVNEQYQLNLYENMGSFVLSQRKGEVVSTRGPCGPNHIAIWSQAHGPFALSFTNASGTDIPVAPQPCCRVVREGVCGGKSGHVGSHVKVEKTPELHGGRYLYTL